jgi:two-component system response regulator HydG/two-component system response regulator AtoC
MIIIDEFAEPAFDLESLRSLHSKQKSAYIAIVRAPGPLSSKLRAASEDWYAYLNYPASPVEIQREIDRVHHRLWTTTQKGISQPYSPLIPQFYVGNHYLMLALKDLIECAAKCDLPILIHGEPGTGRELIANAIHYHSSRYQFPFAKVSCSVFTPAIVERDLFGQRRCKGVQLNAPSLGRCDIAHRGTIFVDDIDDSDLPFQAKLLRLIQEKTFERIKGIETLVADVRILASTRKELSEEIRQNLFSPDLFYRLNIITIETPPLRTIKSDIPALVDHFIKKHSILQDHPQKEPTQSFMGALMEYWFPGNVRELENIVERAMLMAPHDRLEVEHLPKYLVKGAERLHRLPYSFDDYPASFRVAKKQFEKDYITSELIKHCLVISHTAEAIGISRRNLQQKIKQLQINLDRLKEQQSPNDQTP